MDDLAATFRNMWKVQENSFFLAEQPLRKCEATRAQMRHSLQSEARPLEDGMQKKGGLLFDRQMVFSIFAKSNKKTI